MILKSWFKPNQVELGVHSTSVEVVLEPKMLFEGAKIDGLETNQLVTPFISNA